MATIVTATIPGQAASFTFPHHIGEALSAMRFVGAILRAAIDADWWGGELARRLDPAYEGWPEVMQQADLGQGGWCCPMSLKAKWLPSEEGQNQEGEPETSKVLQATAFWGMGLKTGVILQSYTSDYGEHWRILRSWASCPGGRHDTAFKVEVEGGLYYDRGNCTPRDRVKISWNEGWSPVWTGPRGRLTIDGEEV